MGFYSTASSFLSELERRHATLLDKVCVLDFNPVVFHELRTRQVKVLYGDIANANTLAHAGMAEANELIEVVTAAEDGLLDQLREKLDPRLRDRREVLP